MSWLMIAALAIAVFVALVWGLKAPRAGWEAIVAALMLGLAGYAMQGQSGLPGAPAAGVSPMAAPAALYVDERQALSGAPPMRDPTLVLADGYMRNGQYGDAVAMLRAGTDKKPGDCEAWLAMGNALVAHAQGMVSPAALYALRRAATCEPAAPGPPFFTGLALAGSGQFVDARRIWADLLAHAPAGAAWRGGVEQRLGQLDQMIARARAEGALQ